jgi:PAS domain S-box-containing protein
LANRLGNAVERYRAEKERKRQRKAIETAQEGISILNEDGEYIYVNKAYADIYGYDPEEMEGKHWELIYPDSDTAIARDVILPTVAEDGYWSGEATVLRADGTTFVEDHTVAQTDTCELVCSVRDRSVEQKQEVALAQFRTLVETLNDLVYVLDETGQFEYVNDASIEMVGYNRERFIQSSPTLIKSSEVVDRSEDNLGRLLSSNGPDSLQFEIEVQPAKGEPNLCEDHMGVLPYEGESFEGSVGILRDISERKERKQELEQTNTVLLTIVENLPMCVLVEDVERDVLMANDQLGETLGVPINSEEVIGRDCATAVEEFKRRFTDPEAFIEVISERLEHRELAQNEELQLTDGRVLERDHVPYTLPEGEANIWLYVDGSVEVLSS